MDTLIEQLYCNVEKIPFSKLISNTPPKGKEYIILDIDTQAMLAFCSKDYRLRKNSSIYRVFERLLKKENITFKKEIVIVGQTKFYVKYIILSPITSSTKITDLLPMISIWNSYDGTVKTQIHFGYYKMLCGNIFPRPTDCNFHTSSKHSTTDEEFSKYNIPHFIDLYHEFISHSKKDMKLFDKMYNYPADKKMFDKVSSLIKLSPDSHSWAWAELLKESQGGYTYKNHLNEAVMYAGDKISALMIYSAINHAIYHTNNKELPEKKNKRNCDLVEIILKICTK